jgi:hypothetical protein
MITAKRGEIVQSLVMFDQIRETAKKNSYTDYRIAEFYGNMAELIYHHVGPDKCIEVFKEGRMMLWLGSKNYGLKIDNVYFCIDQTPGTKKVQRVEEEEPKEIEEDPNAEEAKGGAAKKKPPAGEDPADLDKEEETEAVINFEKELQYELFDIDQNMDIHNTSDNIYLPYLDTLIKFDLRYVQALCLGGGQYLA